jgi:hypothetical protein
LRPVCGHPVISIATDAIDQELEDAMLKHLSVCAALIAFATGSANAQQHEATLQRIAVPGAGFDIVLAMPKPGGATYNLGNSPDALLVHLIGGELALGFDGAERMMKELDTLQLPVCAFHVEGKASKLRKPVSVYIVPKDE